MKKSEFINFVSKYFLNGNTDSAKLIISNNQLSTNFISSDQNVIGTVTMNSFQAPDAELGVYTTSQLIKMLSALDEDIDIAYAMTPDSKVYSLNFKDKSTNVTYMLADLSVIRQVPNLKTLPEFEVQIELNKEFASTFKKSANALDSDNFGVQSTPDNTKIIINHSSVNTNRIVFDVQTKQAANMDTVCFSAKLFKEILNTNADATGLLEVSSKGLARVTFSNADYSSVYYLVKLTIA